MKEHRTINGNAPKSTAEKLQALADRKAAIIQRIQRLEAQQNSKARKEDTRLKVLVGAAFLADSNRHPELIEVIKATLQRAITAKHDCEFLAAKGWLEYQSTASAVARAPKETL